MATIRFPTRIAHATDMEDSGRYALQATLVAPEGYAVATDGHFVACVNAKVEGLDAPTMIPQELGPKSETDLRADYHANGQRMCEKHSLVKGQRRVAQAEIKEGRFPRIGEVLERLNADKTIVLAINADYLWRLAQAINVPDTPAADTVLLLLPKPDQSEAIIDVIGVLSNHDARQAGDDTGGFGVIMPCDVDAEEARRDFKLLRETAEPSLDAAAQRWNEMYLDRGQTEDGDKPAKTAENGATTEAASLPPSKPQRRRRRKRSVA